MHVLRFHGTLAAPERRSTSSQSTMSATHLTKPLQQSLASKKIHIFLYKIIQIYSSWLKNKLTCNLCIVFYKRQILQLFVLSIQRVHQLWGERLLPPKTLHHLSLHNCKRCLKREININFISHNNPTKTEIKLHIILMVERPRINHRYVITVESTNRWWRH